MFMAVVIDTYSIATLLKRNVDKVDSPVSCFFVAFYNRLRGVSLVGSERAADIGNPDEQFIQASLLPKAVSDAWSALHDEMLSICKKSGYSVDMRKDIVSRVQLQRMLDENRRLAEWLNTRKAIDVIRRFKIPEIKNPYGEITKLQEKVFEKISEIEQRKGEIHFKEVESLKMVSQGLHDALTEVGNQWRKELTTVLELIATLSEGIQNLCQKLESVQKNHVKISADVGNEPE